MQIDYRKRFDRNILSVFRRAVLIAGRRPRQICFFLSALLWQAQAAWRRQRLSRQGLDVPPLLIVSLTRRCNLNCKGCYSKLLHANQDDELSPQRLEEILQEAQALGVSLVMLAGGEPLLRKDLLILATNHPRLIFPVFTNGTLITDEELDFFQKHPNLIPVISLEGGEFETDGRRGEGVFKSFCELYPRLKARKMFWGISLTLTQLAFKMQFSEAVVKKYIEFGCRLFFFVEYVPVTEGSGHLVLTQEQKASIPARTEQLANRYPGLFIAFPGDEDQYGGCLAAGRGFLHINPSGFAEPCPFAPFSDVDMKFSSLRAALASNLMAAIRAQHHLLKEGEGGCALWANRDQMRDLVSNYKK